MDDLTLDDLVDRSSILGLYARYAIGMDQGDRQLFESVWTADAVLVCDALGLHLDGLAEIMGYFHRRPGAAPALPAVGGNLRLAGNHLIQVTGDRATGRAEMAAFRYTGSAMHIYTAGYYNDEFVRTADGWRLSRRDMVVTPIVPAP